MTLPHDVARCGGRMASTHNAFVTVSAGQAECVRCLRRTSPGDTSQRTMSPPTFIDGKCPSRINQITGEVTVKGPL